MTSAEDTETWSAGPEKLASQVARQLEDEIIVRKWPVGEVLGSEPELLERFGVSRSVLREAIRLLEHHSVARMRSGPGGGLVVCAPNASASMRALVIYLEYIGVSVEDLLHARLLLEPLAARLAAGAITEDGIDRLRSIVGKEQEQIGDPNWSFDDEFHILLGSLSGNAVLQLFIEVVMLLTSRYIRAWGPTSREAGAAAKAVAIARHVQIVDAVIAGDAAASESQLSAHLEEIEEWMLANRIRRPSHRMRTRPSDPNPNATKGTKLAEVIAGRIHDDITSDGWQIGEVFGSEPDLLARYEVSRAVLREAIRILEHHSVARMRRGPGGGLVVLAPDPTASIRAIALYLDFEGMSPDHLHLVREVIELGCIQTVTAVATAPDVASRLRAALDHTTVHGDAGDMFHTEVADLADNPVLTLFLRVITDLWTRQSRSEESMTSGVEVQVRCTHDKILEAILLGDDGLAQHRMRRHLQELTTWWH
ncbi:MULTISPECIES: FadR/GntR family transcriptional regulator [Rhodococcus]|uniref:FCD domain-containing protein n=1 Tax=Rhodococcus globerulus TaxID=33008 RepID=A0ABU4C4S1_RHOGO|nr:MULTISPECIES: FCD domain-containing protein [Rhodococcus]MDV6271491.1 FCD domain-containing protein [Rhodococcus globerulus]MDV8071482.1 FCD domain-containing protein [Rhodococcus sp. IEGM 1366]